MTPQASKMQPLAEQALLARAFLKQDNGSQPQIGTVQTIAQDQEVFCEGGNADYFFKVVSGVVRTCKFLADGRRQIDAFYVAGDIFGFETDGPHKLSAEAVTSCTVIAYRRTKVDVLAECDKTLSLELLNFAMRGMAKAQEHSLLLGRRGAVEKVAGFLLAWASNCTNHKTISLAMTRQDIADYLGLTIETVSRTLSQLERDHVIELPSARQIQLRNLDMLEDLAA
jgi:CRP/FNR family transcriptional regulator, nitrogen fixation regulation protein